MTPDIRNSSTLILSSKIMYRYVLCPGFVEDEVVIDGTQHGEEGVHYFKIINKTSWQDIFFGKYRVHWSLHYARIRH